MKQTLLQKLLQYLFIFTSAALMWASFPDLNIWILCIPSLSLLVAATDNVGMWRASWYSFLWAMVFFLPHISWMNVATGQTYIAWVLLAAAQAFFIAFWGFFFSASGVWKFARTWWGEAIVAATLWVGIEQLRSRIPFGGFPWAKIAYVQVDSPLGILAPIGGEVLVSWIAVFVAVILRWVFSGKIPRANFYGVRIDSRNSRYVSAWKRLTLGSIVAVIFLVPLAVKLPTGQQDGSVRVALIQGNVEIPMEETYSIEGKVTGNHLRESLVAIKENDQFDLLIWGEDSIDRNPNTSNLTGAQIEQALNLAEVPLLAGYQEYANDVRYNWMGIWYPKTGQDQQKYGKQHPVPWGEYVPFRELSESLATEAAQVAVDMVPVDNVGILKVTLNDGKVIPIALGICFEAADEPIIAEGVRAGGEMILIPTNNSHFQYSSESTQQLQMLRFRSMEFSRAGMQVSTNGVSAVVGPDGGIRNITGKQESAHIITNIPLRSSITPAAFLGEVPVWIAVGVTMVFGLVSIGVTMGSRRKIKGR